VVEHIAVHKPFFGPAVAADRDRASCVAVSVVIPVFNEEGNGPLLCERLAAVLRHAPDSLEVIAVNDGSRDRSLDELKLETKRFPELPTCAEISMILRHPYRFPRP
jgi:hypothetical protein